MIKLIQQARKEGLLSLSDHKSDSEFINFFLFHLTNGSSPEYYIELGFLRYASRIIPTELPEVMLEYLFTLCTFENIGTYCNLSVFDEYARAILPDAMVDMMFTEAGVEGYKKGN